MELVARLDDYGKLGWAVVMVLGFIVFWPLGLAILAFLLWSGRMGCWKNSGPGRWYHTGTAGERSGPGAWFGGRRRPASSGNNAFDEYREETLKRLEQEQEEFMAFLERLRHAKDKAEFDQFMAEQRRRATEDREPPMGQGESPQPQA